MKDIVQIKEEADAEKVAGEKAFSEDEKLKFRDVAGRALQFFAACDDELNKSAKGLDGDRVFKTHDMIQVMLSTNHCWNNLTLMRKNI